MDSAFIERLRDVLAYDPVTGELSWRVTKGRCTRGAMAGKIAANGYRYVGFEGRNLLAHRLAWAIFYGVEPPPEIDHADRDRLNNAISNLRSASRGMNNGNTGIWRTNTSGYRGVSWEDRRSRWAAYIWQRNRKIHLGYFGTREAAAQAYNQAAGKYFGDFATLNGVAA